VDSGTWVGQVATWPTLGHPSDPMGGGGLGGAAVPGPREGAPSSCFVLGPCSDWAKFGNFRQIGLSSSWDPPKRVLRASLGPRSGARHACVSPRAVGGATHIRLSAVSQPFLGNLAHLARNG
jgi:hypothetical protein